MFNRNLSRRAIPLAAAALLGAASLLPLPAAADVTLNLKDAEINTLISTVSEVTGKNFIVDPRVKGKVTVISAKPMSADAVYQTFLAVLQVQGFAAVPAGRAIKIVPEANVRTDGGTLTMPGTGLPIDDVVTHVFSPVNISASQLVPMLRPLLSQWAHLAAYPGNNTLIVADRAGNVSRLEDIIRRMDSGGDRDVEFVELQNASASEVVRMVTAMVQAAKQADPTANTASVTADERTNSIIIGGDKNERARIAGLVRRLDSPLKERDANTQVVYLKYASAENLAPILLGYAQTLRQASAPGGAAGAAPAAIPTGGGSASGAGEAKVIADKDTNALVITADPKQMRQIKAVIEQLDIQRAQVLVEAVIAEVSESLTHDLGLDFAVYNPNGGAITSILSRTTLTAVSALGALTGNPSAAQIAGGLIGQGATAGGVSIRDGNGTSFGLILRALQTDGDSNILSTPSLVSLDNEESEVKVGQEVAFSTGSFTNTGAGNNGAVNPFTTFDRRDVGLTLAVTPQINEGDTIKLKIKLESSSLASNAINPASPTTNKRTITNTVNVESGQVLVIGGLKSDNITDATNKIPLLGDIPVLGNLFKSRAVTKGKQNLVVFIHPVILRNTEQTDYYTRRKYDSVRGAQFSNGLAERFGSAVVLPPYDEYVASDAMAPKARPAPAPASAPAPVVAVPPPAPVYVAPPAPVQPRPATPVRPTSSGSTGSGSTLVIPAQQPQG